MKAPEALFQLEWRAEFEIGNPAIDHEHRTMIARINDLLIAADAETEIPQVLEHLGEIYAYISAHFALEEKMMRNHHYEHYGPHKDDHEKLLDDLSDIIDQIETNGYIGSKRKFQKQMTDWFISHFKMQDARLHGTLP